VRSSTRRSHPLAPAPPPPPPPKPPPAQTLKELLRLDGAASQQAIHGRAQLSPAQIRGACASKLPAPWSAVVHAHLSALGQLADGQVDAAASAYNSDAGPHLLLVDAINGEPDDLGLAVAFERTMSNARQLADAADRAAAAAGGKGGKVGGALCVRACLCVGGRLFHSSSMQLASDRS